MSNGLHIASDSIYLCVYFWLTYARSTLFDDSGPQVFGAESIGARCCRSRQGFKLFLRLVSHRRCAVSCTRTDRDVGGRMCHCFDWQPTLLALSRLRDQFMGGYVPAPYGILCRRPFYSCVVASQPLDASSLGSARARPTVPSVGELRVPVGGNRSLSVFNGPSSRNCRAFYAHFPTYYVQIIILNVFKHLALFVTRARLVVNCRFESGKRDGKASH